MSALPPIQPKITGSKADPSQSRIRDVTDAAGFEDLLAHMEAGLVVPTPTAPPPPPTSREESVKNGVDRAEPIASDRATDGPSPNQERQNIESERQDQASAHGDETPVDDGELAFTEEELDAGEITDDGNGDEFVSPSLAETQGKGKAPGFRIASTGVANSLPTGRVATAAISAQTPAQFESAALRLETLIRDLTDTAHLRMLKQGREIRVRLNPPDLGRLAMQIRSDDDGVRAVIRVENEAARVALEARTEDLKQELARQGIELKDVDVAVGSGVFTSHAESPEEQDPFATTTATDIHDDIDYTARRATRAANKASERGGFDFRA